MATALNARFKDLCYAARQLTLADLMPSVPRLGNSTRSLLMPYARDERAALALLFLPFLLVASAIAVHQSTRALHGFVAIIAMPEEEIGATAPRGMIGTPLDSMPNASIALVTDSEAIAAIETGPAAPLTQPRERLVSLEPARNDTEMRAPPSPQTLAEIPSAISAVPPAPAPELPVPAVKTHLAFLAPKDDLPASLLPSPPLPIKAFEADENGEPIRPGICAIDAASRLETALVPASLTSRDGEAFGLRLAAAAQSQLGKFVIYDETYRSISYPLGDVRDLYGVCTDVVVRAYRALGIDLQALVHRARSGTGDASIDHRRTEVLRRFFSAHGESLPVTTFSEDYRPGDIVTYYRPQNRRTRAHIAIVSSVIAPSGRPMIVHNRGWGPQLEDALFVDEITGHYRYRGPAVPSSATLDPDKVVDAPVHPASLRARNFPRVERRY